MKDNKQNLNPQKVSSMNMSDIKNFISDKESEIKTILLQKINYLENELTNNIQKNQSLSSSLDKLKEAYKTNLKVIEERDNDLKAYEDKFDSISNVINQKENSIIKLTKEKEELILKLKYEKDQRTKNEDYQKFVINKQNEKSKNDIKELNEINEKNKNEIENLKNTINDKNNEILNLNKILENEKKNFEDLQNSLKNEIEKTNIISKEKIEKISELNMQINKLNQEILNINNEKMNSEKKIKEVINNEQEKINLVNLSNQKIKYMEMEIEHAKNEINKLNSKINEYITQNDKLKDEIFIQKENTTKKNFEVEKNLLEIKLLNNKILDLNSTIDKLLSEKASLNENNEILNKTNLDKINTLTNENIQLKNDIDKLNNKIKELDNINLSLKDSKSTKPVQNNNNIKRVIDDSVQDAVNFFNNIGDNFENNHNEIYNNNLLFEKDAKIRELNYEIERIKNEFNSNENNYLKEIKMLKEQITKSQINKNEYTDLINGLQEKYNNLEKVYEEQKQKIINENKDIIAKLKKENKKLKNDKENLIKLCSDLKIEVNRLENNLSIAQNYIDEANNLNMDINDFDRINENNPEINYQEMNDIKKKTQELIDEKPFSQKHFIEPSKIKQQAIDTIEKVMREKIPDEYSEKNWESDSKFGFNESQNKELNDNNSINDYKDFAKNERSDILDASKLKLLKRTKKK